jgi:NAD(P)-dependent dehydrogenase (short-subunit alcohol dehydrogenase family)
MSADGLPEYLLEVSKLARFPFARYVQPGEKLRVCVTGAGGFIGSHLAKRLKSEGCFVVGCDWKRNEHMKVRFVFGRARFGRDSAAIRAVGRGRGKRGFSVRLATPCRGRYAAALARAAR